MAWRLLSTVGEWPRWLPTVQSVEALDGEALRVGARFHIQQPSLRPATWSVTSLDPGASFTWEARAPGLLMRAEHFVSARGAAACNVTLRFGFGGMLGRLVAARYGATAQRYLGIEAQALRAEATGGPRPALT